MELNDISLDALTVEQKIDLMERIWADLSRRPDSVPAPSWHGDLLDRRRKAVLNGEMDFENWDDVKRTLLQRFK